MAARKPAKSGVKKSVSDSKKAVPKSTTAKKSKKPKKAVASKEVKKTPSKKKVVVSKKNKQESKHITVCVDENDGDEQTIPIGKNTSSTTAVRPRLELALLSPYRYPINYNSLAAQTARVSGLFFVLVGALFAFINIHQLESFYSSLTSHNQFAEVICTTENGTQTCTDSLSSSSSGSSESTSDSTSSSGSTAGTFDTNTTQPVVDFIIESGDILTGVVPIYLYVSGASAVEVFAFERETLTYVRLGNAVKQSGGEWKLDWDTRQYADGEYRLKAKITNIHGTYDNSDFDYVLIKNTQTDSNQETTDTSAISTSNTNDTVSQVEFDFVINGDMPLSGTIRLSVNANDLGKIEVYGDHLETGEEKRIGVMSANGTDSWRFDWNTEDERNGFHNVTVVLYSMNLVEIGRDTQKVEIFNESNSTETSSTGAVKEIAITEPEAKISVSKTNTIEKGGRIEVIVPDAGSVTLYSKKRTSTTKIKIGSAASVDAKTWRLNWNTEAYTDGEYELFAEISNTFGIYPSGHKTFAIKGGFITEIFTTNTITDTKDLTEEISDISDTTKVEGVLYPQVTVEIPQSPLSGYRDIKIFVDTAQFVEVYAKSSFSLVPRFLGLAQKKDTGRWEFRMNTANIPNGSYQLLLKIKNSYGVYESSKNTFSVFNEIKSVITTEASKQIEEIIAVGEAVKEETQLVTTDGLAQDIKQESTFTIKTTTEVTQSFVDIDEESRVKTDEVLKTFRQEMNLLQEQLAIAIRNSDAERLGQVRKDMLDLKSRVLESIAEFGLRTDIVTEINAYLDETIQAYEKLTERNESIIKDRIGDAATVDSDKDGITDYDEVNLYGTDPHSADSDGDGFTDGSEVLGGFNPKDSTPEAVVEYESPQEAGLVREDILEVTSITSLAPDPDDTFTDGVKEIAIISGKGLPNSFVTIYIFSTPVVVTVKTGDDGSWSYTFDKELDDGEHEVYVGITDNAGRIVAKSNPLPFVKTAEAFTAVAASDTTISPEIVDTTKNTLFLSNTMLLIVLSIGVLTIGLVLILLGMHIKSREEKNIPQIIEHV